MCVVGPQNGEKLKSWLVLMQNGDFVPLVEAGTDLSFCFIVDVATL